MNTEPQTTMVWELLHPQMRPENLGYLPGFLDPNDPRPAREQFNERYARGGGWSPMKGHQLRGDNSLEYPGDPRIHPIAQTWLRDELILLYPSDWVAIVQRDRSFEVCRMD
jgi:hypothetical protein